WIAPQVLQTKDLRAWLSPLDATLTKNQGGGVAIMVNQALETSHPPSSSPPGLRTSVADPTSILRAHFQVPYPATPLFATLTKTAGVCTNNSHSRTYFSYAGLSTRQEARFSLRRFTVHGSRITGRQSQATVLSPLQGHSRKGGGAGLGGRRKRVSCNERRPNSCQDHPIGLCESSWVFFPSWLLSEVL